MLRIPEIIRFAPRLLTPEERLEIEQHPIYTVEALKKVNAIDDLARVVAYPTHERCDQSGYPCHRDQSFINPLARIVAVADTYPALTSARPHRRGTSPYTAMMILLEEAHTGRLDRGAVRGFLDCMSLFPVGSHVRLSNGTMAQIIRRNGQQHTRPVVLSLHSDGTTSDTPVDLIQEHSLRVIEALEETPSISSDTFPSV